MMDLTVLAVAAARIHIGLAHRWPDHVGVLIGTYSATFYTGLSSGIATP